MSDEVHDHDLGLQADVSSMLGQRRTLRLFALGAGGVATYAIAGRRRARSR